MGNLHGLLIFLWSLLLSPKADTEVTYVTYTARPENIQFFYRQSGEQIKRLAGVARMDKKVRFATNATMFGKGYVPIGLYIENGKRVRAARVFNNPSVNFGMQPQAVFAITKGNKAVIVPIQQRKEADYTYAVQCAPMLVMGGKINPKLTRSNSSYTRSGYGILKDGRVLFALSTETVTFQQFARFFVEKGCTEAVYIDGVVSDYWTPSHEPEPYSEFGIMVGAY
jgi:uncharacterized protein YigE (DUF2233 family)